MSDSMKRILKQILATENSLKSNKHSFIKHQNTGAKSSSLAQINSESLEDYKELKENLQNIDLSVNKPQMAYQPVRIMLQERNNKR